MLVHKQRFEKENNREPRWHDELFKLTRTNKKTGEFCSTKAEGAQKEYETKMRQNYWDEAHWPRFDESVWHTVTGMNAHGDNYGLGALGKTRSMIRTGGSSSHILTQVPSSQIISSAPVPHILTQEQINAISGQVLASIETKVLALVETKLDQFFKRTTKKIKRMVSRAFPDEGGSHHTSVPDIQVDDRDEGEDDDDDTGLR